MLRKVFKKFVLYTHDRGFTRSGSGPETTGKMATGKPHNDRQMKIETEMAARVPEQVWSKFDTNVELVYSANPVRIQTRPNAKLSWRKQYYMKPEAQIAPTIECLIAAGVLIETKSDCNTPLFPVLKADKKMAFST